MGRVRSLALFVVACLVMGCATIAPASAPVADGTSPMAGGRGDDAQSVPLPPGPAPTPVPRVEPQGRSIAPANGFPYTAQPEWIPTPYDHDAGRAGAPVDYIVIHYTAISYERTLRAFNNPSSRVSAHYVVRGDGHIAQLVGESDTAWHAGNYWYNQHSVGIEIEKDAVTNPDFTAAQYYATAALACAIAARHGIPLDRGHVFGHNEIPGTDHTDPGPTWSWPHFMWLTTFCAAPNAVTVHATYIGQTAFPAISVGQSASVTVTLRNAGSTAWRKGTKQEARLAIPGNDTRYAFLGDGWPTPDRVAGQNEDLVLPGGWATFTFRLKGTKPGTFTLPLRGVIDGGAWMDDMGIYVTVNVQPAPPPTSLVGKR
jgi:N-acetylmuramoyl-L-alanine amidase